MKIICHRGLWGKSKSKQNSLSACVEAADNYDGIEIDLKNKNGEIVLSHDPLTKKKYPDLAALLKARNETFYAFNIKEDGLGSKLAKLVRQYRIKQFMCFDLSTPEKVMYQKLGLSCFERFSDHEPFPENSPAGIVVDIFSEAKEKTILAELVSRKPKAPLFIISPELHGRSHEAFWGKLRSLPKQSTIFLCTDKPREAKAFFK